MTRRPFVIAILVLQYCMPASAGWFGPSNYDECILDSMKGVSSDVAAVQVRLACRRKFPDTPEPKVPSRLLSPAELSQITGRAGLSYDNRYSGNLYNGNAGIKVTEVTIYIDTKGPNEKYWGSKTYSLDVNIPPLTARDFGV